MSKLSQLLQQASQTLELMTMHFSIASKPPSSWTRLAHNLMVDEGMFRISILREALHDLEHM